MTSYKLTKDAELDLAQFVEYSLDNWGLEYTDEYVKDLKSTFDAIGNGSVYSRTYQMKNQKLPIAKVRNHFIFYLKQRVQVPTIIGIIHESRDIVNVLKPRI